MRVIHLRRKPLSETGTVWSEIAGPVDESERVTAAFAQVRVLNARVGDENLRSLVNEFAVLQGTAVGADTQVQAEQSLDKGVQTFSVLNDRIGDLLSTLNDIEVAESR